MIIMRDRLCTSSPPCISDIPPSRLLLYHSSLPLTVPPHSIHQQNKRYTFTGLAVVLILPQETASSGLAPESLPSNSCAVLISMVASLHFHIFSSLFSPLSLYPSRLQLLYRLGAKIGYTQHNRHRS